jgi:hypothetical protein
MTALRNFQFAQVRARRATRRVTSSLERGQALRLQVTRRIEFARPVRWPWTVGRALSVGAEVLFGLWTLAVLGLFIFVGVSLVR